MASNHLGIPRTLRRNYEWVSDCCLTPIQHSNTDFIVFGLTRQGLEPTIYHTRGEHANQYATGEEKK